MDGGTSAADTKVQVEQTVQKIIEEILRNHALEEAFAGYIVRSEEADKLQEDVTVQSFVSLWQSLTPDLQDVALKHYVSILYNQVNPGKCEKLYDTLELLVQRNVLQTRSVCEALMNNEKLMYKQPNGWVSAFKLIRRIVGGNDYKGCRDLLRFILERTQTLPTVDNTSSLKLLDAIYDVVSYILDRNACLLPSYFAVNEITKLFAEDKPSPHWRLGQLLADFVQSFRPAAQMVSICGRSKLLPIVGHSNSATNVWRLNTSTLRFALNGPLPYDKELFEPQTDLLRYVLQQPYSRDMVCNMLSLNKQVKLRCCVLEEQLVDPVILAMERSEAESSQADVTEGGVASDEIDSNSISNQLWQHLSSQLIFFVLFQFASFPHMVLTLYDKLKMRNLKKGRDQLMWILLQFISGSIQKNALGDFLPVMKLYDLLYPETVVIPVPDVTKPSCTFKLAVTSIWIHLNKKASNDQIQLQRSIPHALSGHIEYLQQNLASKNMPTNDYRIALLCNAYSTNSEYFSVPMGVLAETIYGTNQKTILLPGGVAASAPTQPLAMSLLDSLTVHAKMSLIHTIVTRVIRLAQNSGKSALALAPALVETYSRLLVYIEIESLGIKGFISQLLPSVFKASAWGILHTLLEMFSYRLHHIQPHYRIQLLSQLHSLIQVPQTNLYQLHLCVESTALRLIMGLGSWEVQPQLSRMLSEPKSVTILSGDSEELNRIMILTLARAMHVTGSESVASNWCKDILVTIMQNTPHSWSSHTLSCMPTVLSEYFQQNPVPREDKNALRRNVEADYRKWKSMAGENDLINHFTNPSNPPLFLCVLWKSILEDNRISPTGFKVLDRLGPRALAGHLRAFSDYLVGEFSVPAASQLINKYVESLNDLIWKCHVIPIDRLILCLSLRCLEGNEAQICFFIIQVLLLKSPEFFNRINEFVSENSSEHWLQNDYHEKHMAFHKKYPEKYYFENLPGAGDQAGGQGGHQYLPVYFGNVCMRFLPVFDIVIHRFLEQPPMHKTLESLLDHLGGLYKFHDRPLTYLYSTLHYYEKKLRDRPAIKKKLVQAIVGSMKEMKPQNWCLSTDYQSYIDKSSEQNDWSPSDDYYHRLIARLVDTIAGQPAYPSCDWRFNEFPNSSSHALHCVCIELMALPVPASTVGNALFNLVLRGMLQIPRDSIMSWMNAIGVVVTALPEGYWSVLNDRIVEAIEDPQLSAPRPGSQVLELFNFCAAYEVIGEQSFSYVLALCHAVWEHASIGHLTLITQFMKERLKPVIKREEQFLFVCHLVGPFLQRFHLERTRCMLELTVELYEMLERVDKNTEHIQHMDSISDFLYHIKYMFVGDGVKNEVEKVIRNLRPALQHRLRYISHHSKEEPSSATGPPSVNAVTTTI